MELGVRDWMIIIGGLLILAVLLDGYRRMRSSASAVKISLAEVPEEDTKTDEFEMLRELPNGGARVIARQDLLNAARESAGRAAEAAGNPSQEPEPELATGLSAQRDEPLDLPDRGDSLAMNADDGARSKPSLDEEVVMLHVVARADAGFSGEDILHILLACDMRYGEMEFFHRHEEAAGRGSIQFSVANMLQPGVFDIDAMSDFVTPGLIFFLRLPGPADMMKAFECMLETAQCVAENLEGDLLDESRSVATKQTLEHIRQRIRDMERRLLTHASR
jgi:cell division protein ZipA